MIKIVQSFLFRSKKFIIQSLTTQLDKQKQRPTIDVYDGLFGVPSVERKAWALCRDENTDGIEDPRLQTTSGVGFACER